MIAVVDIAMWKTMVLVILTIVLLVTEYLCSWLLRPDPPKENETDLTACGLRESLTYAVARALGGLTLGGVRSALFATGLIAAFTALAICGSCAILARDGRLGEVGYLDPYAGRIDFDARGFFALAALGAIALAVRLVLKFGHAPGDHGRTAQSDPTDSHTGP